MFTKKHHCYIVQAEDHIKIGFTSNLEHRLKALQTGNHLKFELVAAFRHWNAKRAEAHEQRLHRKFRRHHVRGEWFKAKPIRRHLTRRKFWRGIFVGVSLVVLVEILWLL